MGQIKNRTIFTGDNLEIMRGMESESVDLIYLDPPFNSKHDYSAPIGSTAAGAAFKDTWSLSDIDVAWWGEIAESNISLYEVLDMARHVGGKSAMSYLIYMSIRILEMHRILKETGSLYLHCDPTMSHYLKMVLDAVFEFNNYRNEVIWKRSSGHPLSIKKFDAITDTILVYQKSDEFVFKPVLLPQSEEMINRNYRHADEHGRYASDNLTGGKAGGESAYMPFRGVYPPKGRGWAPPTRAKIPKWAANKLPDDYEELNQVEKCEALDMIGLIYWTASGKPRLKKYLATNPTRNAPSLWDDIKPISNQSKERLSYPTQKPLALLERIIKASSSEGDMILDPFCGCATACSAAERLNRKWVGIDISSKAADLMNARLITEAGMDKFTKGAGILIHRTDIPIRKGNRSKNVKHQLFGMQEGRCNLCRHEIEFKNMEVDHVIPRAKGGADDDSNLQLLCGHCNRVKGKGTMADTRVRLQELGISVRD